MASVTKFTAGAVYNQLRHNLRQIAHSGNPDIDPARLRQDYVLSPDRGMSDYDYFQERLSQLYVYGRNDVKVMAGCNRTTGFGARAVRRFFLGRL